MPDPHMPDFVIEDLRRESDRLRRENDRLRHENQLKTDMVTRYRDHATQINLALVRLAAENYEMGRKLQA